MFIGEAPGAEEDLQGRPFVGAAGQVLNNLLNKLGLRREEVYITNVVKSRPPGNRDPEPDEIEACLPFLKRQIAAIRPEVIVTLGKIATQALLGVQRAHNPTAGAMAALRPYPGDAHLPSLLPAAVSQGKAQDLGGHAAGDGVSGGTGRLGGSFQLVSFQQSAKAKNAQVTEKSN